MTARRRSRSDLFRVRVSLLVTIVVVLLVLATGTLAPGDGAVDATATLVPVSLLGRPLSTALSVGWSAASYSRLDEQALRSAASSSRLDEQALRSAAEEEARGERRLLSRTLGATGATGTTLSAAVPAIVVTVAIAQRTEFRSEPPSIAAALLAVASSWVLMVFSVAQACLRLESRSPRRSQVRIAFEEAPHFSDDATLALLLSTTAATVSAEIRSREGWRLVRANVVIASAFDSVVIAMTVSLLFGGLAA
ncbi:MULTISPECIES: DUF1345 domain-containing protein [unclassified Rathayibacter]|jgi:hypothetical protein|uniref:DUF1345 domain-containing protein n=1 Tax=unclassified Rathayibacter TaxID=2609250 RepID=UPI000CE723D7|nr:MULTISPECIES: DUF1345 domain-containing protein [unclassified Rathayibacter]PPF09353.1 hypothetical protein C5B98_16330 [Rathayibacter sp. AY1A5]PPF42065.1 hypothetical protein C5E14_16335 [Rathayibacter sp. AY1A1]PPG80286.1 hypothetical protein C5C29_16645 [Rathayibacter sp. AY1H2]PPG94677.1 hypothetical protein C5C32_16795 [Rathayibacter sp. AY1G9]